MVWSTRLFPGKRKEKVISKVGGDKGAGCPNENKKRQLHKPFLHGRIVMPLSIDLKDSP